jgi:hypothetical protein
MPNFDGTGPEGKGPMTGLSRGYCVIPLTSSKKELDFLKQQETVLEAQLKQIRSRMQGMNTEKEVHNAGI